MQTFTRQDISPLMNAAILAFPPTKERAVKGSELLATGKVQRLADAPAGVDRWLVYGSSAQPYNVSLALDSCTCPDRAATCKHKHACRFALGLGVVAPVEVGASLNDAPTPDDPDADLWAATSTAPTDAILDAEIAAKLDEMVAAGLDAEADLLVIGDWVWLVGDVDPDLADALGCRWHERREVHYWRPVWAAMDVDGYNERKDLAGLAQKYGLKKTLPRRSRRREERSAQELAMLIVPRLNRDEDGDLWA